MRCEGTLLDADREQLDVLLVSCEEYRTQYLDYIQVHAELRWRFRQGISKQDILSSPETTLVPSRPKSWLNLASRYPKGPSLAIAAAVMGRRTWMSLAVKTAPTPARR